MVRSRILEDLADVAALADRWRDLLDRSASPQIVSTPTWLLTWWKYFGDADGRKLRVIVVEDDGNLVGLAPLSIRTVVRHAIPIRRLELLGSGEDEQDEICSDYVGVIAARDREADVARAVAQAIARGRVGHWDDLSMPMMSGEDRAIAPLCDALAGARIESRVSETGRCRYVPLPSSWAEYLASLEGAKRYAVNRALRDLDAWAGGTAELVRASNAAELAEARDVLHALHAERWLASGKRGVFASERFTRFHDDVMRAFLDGAEGATLDLLRLVVRGESIAAIYNFVYRGKVSFYQSGRKLDVPKRCQPGIAIHALAIRRAIEHGYGEYDFLGGDSQQKRTFALASRPLVTLRAVAPTLRARAIDAARGIAERATVLRTAAIGALHAR